VKVALSAFFIAEVARSVLSVKGRRMGGGVRWFRRVVQPWRRAGGVRHPNVARARWRVGGALAVRVAWAAQNRGGGRLMGGPPECMGPSHSGRGADDRWDLGLGK
jgi:hypothetical protein